MRLAQSAPGFNSVKTGPGVSKPFIHGLGYNRVLTLYDGVRQESQQWGDEHGIVVDDYNIDRAEIIKRAGQSDVRIRCTGRCDESVSGYAI